MLKAIILKVDDSGEIGLTKEQINPIYDLVFPNDPSKFNEWFQESLIYCKQKEESQISIVLNDKFDGELITHILLLYPNHVYVTDYFL